MLEKYQLEEILLQALKTGGDFAEIFIENKYVTGIQCEASKVDKIISGKDIGAGIRLIKNNNTLYAYTNDISYKNLLDMASKLAQAVNSKQNNLNIDLHRSTYNLELPVDLKPTEVKLNDKVNVVQDLDIIARNIDARIKQVAISYGDVVQNVTIANSNGVYVEDKRVRTRLTVNAVATEGNLIQTGYDALGGTGGFEIIKNNHPEYLAENAAKRALLMLKAKPAPAGKMTVVMAGEAGGTMVHEACGHGLEADLVQKKLSVYANKVGEKVASENITVVDDGTIPNKYGSYRFDDEGTPAQKTILIENGVLNNYMYDYLCAKKDNHELTGNGRRESYKSRPIPRMRNTYIAPGKDKKENIIASTKKGILVKKMGGGQVNTINGDFVFDVPEAYLIENGEIGEPIRGVTLTGNGPQVLQLIDMIGDDLGYSIGTCGKDGQGAPVSDAQPTIRIPELLVGGIIGE